MPRCLEKKLQAKLRIKAAGKQHNLFWEAHKCLECPMQEEHFVPFFPESSPDHLRNRGKLTFPLITFVTLYMLVLY